MPIRCRCCRAVGPAALVAVIAVAAAPAPARAAVEPEFALSLGYTHVSLDETTFGDFAEEGGFHFEPRFSVAPWDERPQLRLGFGLGFTSLYDESDGQAALIDEDGDVFLVDSDDYENLFLLTPELQVSWRQRWDNGFVLEAGVGVGGAFGFYSAGDEFFGEFFDEEVSESDAVFTARPFLRTGLRSDGFTFGLETSYLWGLGGSLDFDNNIGGDLEQWYLGVFLAFTR